MERTEKWSSELLRNQFFVIFYVAASSMQTTSSDFAECTTQYTLVVSAFVRSTFTNLFNGACPLQAKMGDLIRADPFKKLWAEHFTPLKICIGWYRKFGDSMRGKPGGWGASQKITVQSFLGSLIHLLIVDYALFHCSFGVCVFRYQKFVSLTR